MSNIQKKTPKNAIRAIALPTDISGTAEGRQHEVTLYNIHVL
jgi:hypothetical protein